jgi:hypothetical protein
VGDTAARTADTDRGAADGRRTRGNAERGTRGSRSYFKSCCTWTLSSRDADIASSALETI